MADSDSSGGVTSKRGAPSDPVWYAGVLIDVLRGVLIAGAVVLLVLFAGSGDHMFIYQGF